MRNCLCGTAAICVVLATGVATAASAPTVVDITRISSSGVGEKIGTVTITEGKKGLSFRVAVKGLPAGRHGFHLHAVGNCGPAQKDGKPEAGAAAGDHYDPDGMKSHRGPRGTGHKGDLPVLTANKREIAQTVTAPRLKLADVRGKALVIHEGGDNYTDRPENGGGAGRIACGVVPGS